MVGSASLFGFFGREVFGNGGTQVVGVSAVRLTSLALPHREIGKWHRVQSPRSGVQSGEKFRLVVFCEPLSGDPMAGNRLYARG